ncbi:lysosomal alpha-mannosidase [Onthophagus taurus]|uniref:lysosomal alpha-mannosidase n=1 Tax=Onthophagus taurus TaxID=166361 RepID=UPI0039BE83C7
MRFLLTLMFFVFQVYGHWIPSDKCGYESCHKTKPGMINVHIVPHTHDDVGWLKTVDQYYYGSKQDIQKAGVQYILDSVMDSLRKNKDRRFIYVETAFFWKWWMKQHDFMKHNVKKFVNNGQLEFIGGGWSMNDEAATHYQSTIDQFTWGLRKLNETFGACGIPKVGWQIDPFGHSREMASMFSQMGYDGLLLGRIDYQDKSFKFETKSPEFVWRATDSLGNNTDLFTTVMYNTYGPPPGFCFDTLCDDEPIIDNKKSPDYNVDKRVKEFFEYLDNVTNSYATDNVIITMGEDFNYQDANMWFKNLDKLIQYGNEMQKNGSKYHLLYSTPSCYLKAVKDNGKEKKISFPIKSDDFFPYASDPNSYWTGYFTSRPTLKRFERMGNNFLQVCKQLYCLVDLGPEDWVDLNFMREAMGVMQHHDAITGTEKQHVAFDYARMLSKGFDECQFITATALSQLVTGHDPNKPRYDPLPEIQFESCLLANVSQCAFTEKENNFIVTVYNPLSRPVDYHVRLPVTGSAYDVLDSNGTKIPRDLIPTADFIQKIPGRFSASKAELVFKAEQVPALGFLSYYVQKSSGNNILQAQSGYQLKQGNIRVNIEPNTGKIENIQMNGKTVQFTQDFLYYFGAVGNNEISANRSSGAYIFRPNSSEPIQMTKKVSYRLYQGSVVSELHQVFNEWTSQILRVYNEENNIEFDWVVGPIPNDTIAGKEVITRYTTNLKSDSIFYTDSNGRETLKRVRNFRPTWKLNISEPVSGNYYPVTTKISMRSVEDDVEVAILTDRAQGGTSLNNGELELMLHRSCKHDDAFGVGEELMEQAFGKGLVARGTHYLVLGPYLSKGDDTVAAQEHDVIQRKVLSAWTFLSPTNNLNPDQYRKTYKMEFSGLQTNLPNNVQILTLEPWKGMDFLLRLEHVFEADEDLEYSKPVSVNLKELFSSFDIISYRETTLGANQWIENKSIQNVDLGEKMEAILAKKVLDNMNTNDDVQDTLKWNSLVTKYNHDQTKSNDIWISFKHNIKNPTTSEIVDDFIITLKPMEIKTFVIEIKMKI